MEAIYSRRSCKNFDPEKTVPADIIQKICEAGTKAASGMNKQAAKIIVINNKEIRDMIVKKNAEIMERPGVDTFYGAQQMICVVGNTDVHTYVYDGSLVMGNMMLAAEELGIASCWIHRAKQFFDMPEGKEVLKKAGLNGNYEGIGNLAIGYAAAEKRPDPDISPDYISYIK